MVRRKSLVYAISLHVHSYRSGHIEILSAISNNLGIPQSEIVELHKGRKRYLSIYVNSLVQARMIQRRLEALKLHHISIQIKSLSEEDWQDRWKTDLKPFHLTKQFDVVPAWWKDRDRPTAATPSYIDTALAFGTGLHETTRFVTELIEQCRGRFESFLDIGTGTGILSIVALHCGAQRLEAMDINRDCLKTAKANLRLNGYHLKNFLRADIRTFREKKQYDFIAANLFTQDLIEAGKKIISLVKPGKYLAVSGISIDHLPLFKRAFAKFPLKCLKIKKGKAWVAVLYKKAECLIF